MPFSSGVPHRQLSTSYLKDNRQDTYC